MWYSQGRKSTIRIRTYQIITVVISLIITVIAKRDQAKEVKSTELIKTPIRFDRSGLLYTCCTQIHTNK